MLILTNSFCVYEYFFRSGEVLVETELVQSDISLTRDELSRVFTYHIFTFYSVLRLEKYPMVFNSSEEHNCVVFVPLLKSAVGARQAFCRFQFSSFVIFFCQFSPNQTFLNHLRPTYFFQKKFPQFLHLPTLFKNSQTKDAKTKGIFLKKISWSEMIYKCLISAEAAVPTYIHI